MELEEKSPVSHADDKSKKRNIHVTAKYNRKQMRLRLNIEEWMDGQLRKLYECEVNKHFVLIVYTDGV